MERKVVNLRNPRPHPKYPAALDMHSTWCLQRHDNCSSHAFSGKKCTCMCYCRHAVQRGVCAGNRGVVLPPCGGHAWAPVRFKPELLTPRGICESPPAHLELC